MTKPRLVAIVCHGLLLVASCASTARRPPLVIPPPPSYREVVDLLIDVADRQLARPPAETAADTALFYSSLLGLSDLTGGGKYLGVVRAMGEAQSWSPQYALPILGLYQRDRVRRTVGPTLAAFDDLCRHGVLDHEAVARQQVARPLLMPSLALASTATGRAGFLACAAGSVDRAQDRTLGLSAEREVLGLIRLLDNAPLAFAGRAQARASFDEVMRELGAAQPDDRPSWWRLHALAAGVNRGLLDPAAHRPAIERAWQALSHAPRPTTAEESAACLFAGAELYRLKLLDGSRAVTVTATNPIEETRFDETLELSWSSLTRALAAAPGDPLVVLDGRSGVLLLSQPLDENGDGTPDKLLVSVSLQGKEARPLVVRRLAQPYRAPVPAARAYGRFVPEVHDDFAWENDRVAFRVSGPAVEALHVSSGIDVWGKRIREPVIDRWYRQGDLQHDRGEGLDFYQVGPSRGCGGLGLWDGQDLSISRNFRRSRLIADGPVRVVFELDYDTWGPAQARVTERKRISLDIGQNLSRIETRFTVAGPPRSLPVAVGILRRGVGTLARDEPTTWLSYVEPPQGGNGQIGCGVVGPETVRFVESDQHYLLVRDHPSDRSFVYYAGAYWSKAPDFRQPDEWAVYLAAFSRRAGAPIVVAMP